MLHLSLDLFVFLVIGVSNTVCGNFGGMVIYMGQKPSKSDELKTSKVFQLSLVMLLAVKLQRPSLSRASLQVLGSSC